MRKLILKIFLLAILSTVFSLTEGSLQAQTFSTSKYDSVTALSRWTWIKLPTGINSIEVNADSSGTVLIAFTGAGARTTQRKDSVNIFGRIKAGQTRWIYSRDNDSIGFKGTGKVYYWIHRGQGNPTYFNQSQGSQSVLPYKVYTALVTQEGTNDPTYTVLQNTFGDELTFERVDVGRYSITSAGAFTEGKSWFVAQADGISNIVVRMQWISEDVIEIGSLANNFSETDYGLYNTPIEIRVYN